MKSKITEKGKVEETDIKIGRDKHDPDHGDREKRGTYGVYIFRGNHSLSEHKFLVLEDCTLQYQ